MDRLPAHILDKIMFEPTTGCWLWIASTTWGGYGQVAVNRKPKAAHRVVYRLLRGEIPDRMTCDHLCRNRACVNPDHIEIVTQRINLLRGVGRTAINASRTHCPQGHVYDEHNTGRARKGSRYCKTCIRLRVRDYYARKRAERRRDGTSR